MMNQFVLSLHYIWHWSSLKILREVNFELFLLFVVETTATGWRYLSPEAAQAFATASAQKAWSASQFHNC